MFYTEQSDSCPIRARTLAGIYITASIGAVFLLGMVWPGEYDLGAPWPHLATIGLWHVIAIWILVHLLSKSDLSLPVIIGKVLPPCRLIRLLPLVILTIAISFAGVYLLFMPLSYIAPAFVEFWLIDGQSPMFWTEGALVSVANLLNFLGIVVLAPVFEEFVFRGLLLNRLAAKWGAPTGILFSSVAFGVLHPDIVGGIFFGFIASVLYIKTCSLLAPITFHGASNLFVYVLSLVETALVETGPEYTLQQFREGWWLGVVGVVVGLPWAIRFTRRFWPDDLWRTPLQDTFRSDKPEERRV